MGKESGSLASSFILALGSTISLRGKDLLNLDSLNIKGILGTAISMGKDCSYLIMEIVMKAITLMVSLKAKEFITGAMGQLIRANSKMDSDLDMEFGNSGHKNMKELT